MFLLLPLVGRASTISGTVADVTGAVIPYARVEIAGENLSSPFVIACDALGHFVSPDLKPGTYFLRVAADGFEPLEQTVQLSGNEFALELHLAPAVVKQEITVLGGAAQFANSDPVYKRLRAVGPGAAFKVDGLTLKCDAATFELRQGTLTFLAPVEGVVTGAVFIGEGHFTLTPATPIAARELQRRAKADHFAEDFTVVVFRYAGEPAKMMTAAVKTAATAPEAAGAALQHWRGSVRRRREVPLGFSDALLQGDAMENVEAEVLASLYNPSRPGFFDAYIRGVSHKHLRFLYRPLGGAIPELGPNEEVALINHDPESMDDGIWYLDHRVQEYANRTASSQEERRYVVARKFKIETVIGKNDHLTSVATVTVEPLLNGERVLKFRLLPNLRVTSVKDAQGNDLFFVQESRKEDGSFYIILPQAMEKGKEYALTVAYSGDKVLTRAGTDSYYVRARESWYPNLGFNERALYDLTYKVPKKFKLISVGRLEREWTEGDSRVTHWTTPQPVAVAGFNFGEYQKLELPDPTPGYGIEGYYLADLPAQFVGTSLSTLRPRAMTQYALEQTRAQIQLCNYYFGHSAFDRIYVTEQPDFNFGQSWPNLVYLPLSAYTDSTQRVLLFGRISRSFTAFVEEVTPHEVAHQWWGHTVGWASYHDEWLSEGFAEFSAGLFLQHAMAGDWVKDYLHFWDRLRHRILDKNVFGVAPNDAGPLWLGLRLISPRTQDAYLNVTYPKGAYVLAMLRSMMYAPEEKDRDARFIAMMHDFIDVHRGRLASTESFKAVVERHMTPAMDLGRNGRMDWFFNQWVYGTEVPRYKFAYELSPAAAGKTQLRMTLTQSEVDDNFAMLVPVFADFGKGMARIGQIPVIGNTSRTVELALPMPPKKVVYNYYKQILER